MLEELEIEIKKLESKLISLDEDLEFSENIIKDPKIKGYRKSDAYSDVKYYREEMERIVKKLNELKKQKDELLGISNEPNIEQIVPTKK